MLRIETIGVLCCPVHNLLWKQVIHLVVHCFHAASLVADFNNIALCHILGSKDGHCQQMEKMRLELQKLKLEKADLLRQTQVL